MHRRFVEAARRAEIVALLNRATSPARVARITCDELCGALDAEVAFVLAADPRHGQLETIGQTGLDEAQTAALGAHPLCRSVLGTRRAEVHSGSDLLALGARAAMLAPWGSASGREVVVGAVRLYDVPFDPVEVALLEAVAPSTGQALERTWLGAERDSYASRQAALARAARRLTSSLVVDQVLADLCAEACAALDGDASVIVSRTPPHDVTVIAGSGAARGATGRRLAAAPGLWSDVLRTGRAQVRQPLDRRPIGGIEGIEDLASVLAAPIDSGNGATAAVLVGYRRDRRIEPEDADLLAAFAELGAIACRNASDHAAMAEAAAHDSLTGCLNHGAFQDRLREEIARARRNGGALGLVLMDLNDFKQVNDQLGHQMGDALLRAVADALRNSIRPYDQVARYGGDEFALLLPQADELTAARVVDRALSTVASVSLPAGIAVSATAGVAHWRQHENADELVARADSSLLETKRARRRPAPEGGRDEGGAAEADRDRRERQRLRRLATAGRLGARLTRLLDRQAIAETAIVELGASLGFETCVLVRGDGGRAEVIAAGGMEGAGRDHLSSWPQDSTGSLRRCLRTGRAVRVSEIVGARSPDPAGRQFTELAVPVHAGSTLWGALGVRAAAPGAFDEDDAALVQSVSEHLGSALHTSELYEQLDRTHLGTAEALAAALEAKDHYTADHAHSIADLAVAVGEELGLAGDALRDLRYGAVFHDIGKIAISDAILNKPGPLDEREFAEIRRHPAVGEQILTPVPFLSGVRRIVRHDHERWDGAGYPDGLSGEEIPIGARIVLVVDAYHAMRSDRPYRRAMTAARARHELLGNAGTQFDPQVVQALLAVLQRAPELEPA